MSMKRIMAMLLAGAMTLGMAGCAGSAGDGAGNGAAAEAQSESEGSDSGEAVSDEPVKIATKPMTEQFILGERDMKLNLQKESAAERATYSRQWRAESSISTRNILPADGFWFLDMKPVR